MDVLKLTFKVKDASISCKIYSENPLGVLTKIYDTKHKNDDEYRYSLFKIIENKNKFVFGGRKIVGEPTEIQINKINDVTEGIKNILQ